MKWKHRPTFVQDAPQEGLLKFYIVHYDHLQVIPSVKLAPFCAMLQFLCPVPKAGFVLLLEVLEKPWNLILDFKGA